MNWLTKLPLLSVIPLIACGVVPTPVVADYNGASVKLNIPVTFGPAEQDAAIIKADAEALRICQAGKHVRAEYASTLALPNYGGIQRLYLCLD